MEKQVYDSRLKNANRVVRLSLGIAGILAIVVIVLSGVVYQTMFTQRVVLLPPDVKGPISFDGNGAYDQKYLTQMAQWFVQLTLTYSPANYDHQIDQVLYYADPEVQGALTAQLRADKVVVERRKYSSVFYADGVEVQNGVVGITGRLHTFVGSKLVEAETKAYRVRFTRLSTGRIAVREIKESQYENPLTLVSAVRR